MNENPSLEKTPEEKKAAASKCDDVRSKDLAGRAPGDRGACEKESAAQGGE